MITPEGHFHNQDPNVYRQWAFRAPCGEQKHPTVKRQYFCPKEIIDVLEGVLQWKQGISVYLGTQSDGWKEGPLEAAAMFPVQAVVVSPPMSSTHSLKPEILRKRSSSLAKACGLSMGSANMLWLRSVSHTSREDSLDWTSGCQWDSLN